MIRAAHVEDAGDIAWVHIRSWQQAYRELMPVAYLASLEATQPRREALWRQSIEQANEAVFVAEVDGRVVGWIAVSPSRDEDADPGNTGEVQAVYVLAEYWGTGVGRALWLRGLEHLASQGLETATLWVLAGNRRAIRFYQNAGWTAQAESSRPLTRGGCELEEIRYQSQKQH
ncbi:MULTISPECIES: GNAT family N-acetyltransferase [unclassified Pseudomonas]|uniref:GNAT family N-acetyltransferase n=1 Tax=unclassified Pseudomonas TaxID=196821 RepID=UPI0015A012F3|nr:MULTISPECIES: GNAT family N-acetyltransferase [unclassified Pseudomonas]NWC96967.1 GNAT family N-acetyltransferase [Pseudomonas sp. IPO3779]NWD21452.1 GNAT family N-acetyltransferase [Pseudomonas sp. IPO3778]